MSGCNLRELTQCKVLIYVMDVFENNVLAIWSESRKVLRGGKYAGRSPLAWNLLPS